MKNKKRVAHWDCRETAKNYVNTTSVLAGFAFTAIILVLDKNNDISAELKLLKDWACIAFLVSFFGFIVTSFTFSIVSGEENVNSRAFTMMLIGGCGISISGGFLFWGMVLLMKVFSQSEISEVSIWIFMCAVFLTLLYLIFVVIDIFYVFGDETQKQLTPFNWGKLLTFSFLPIVFGIVIRYAWIDVTPVFIGLKQIMAFALALIVLGGGFAVWVSNQAEAYKLTINHSAYWISLHSLVFSILIILLP